MDFQSKRLRVLVAGGIFVVLFQMSALGANYFSFGKSVNQSFGPDYLYGWVSTKIFVPVSGTVQNIDLATLLFQTW